jgi:hypothetical protein
MYRRLCIKVLSAKSPFSISSELMQLSYNLVDLSKTFIIWSNPSIPLVLLTFSRMLLPWWDSPTDSDISISNCFWTSFFQFSSLSFSTLKSYRRPTTPCLILIILVVQVGKKSANSYLAHLKIWLWTGFF